MADWQFMFAVQREAKASYQPWGQPQIDGMLGLCVPGYCRKIFRTRDGHKRVSYVPLRPGRGNNA